MLTWSDFFKAVLICAVFTMVIVESLIFGFSVADAGNPVTTLLCQKPWPRSGWDYAVFARPAGCAFGKWVNQPNQ